MSGFLAKSCEQKKDNGIELDFLINSAWRCSKHLSKQESRYQCQTYKKAVSIVIVHVRYACLIRPFCDMRDILMVIYCWGVRSYPYKETDVDLDSFLVSCHRKTQTFHLQLSHLLSRFVVSGLVGCMQAPFIKFLFR